MNNLQPARPSEIRVVIADDQAIARRGTQALLATELQLASGTRAALYAPREGEAIDITGLTGITEAQRGTLVTLGAIERSSHTPPSR